MIGMSKIRGSGAGAAEDYYFGKEEVEDQAKADRGAKPVRGDLSPDRQIDYYATETGSGPSALTWQVIGDDRGFFGSAGIQDGDAAKREAFRMMLDGRMQGAEGWAGATADGDALLAQNVGEPDRVAAMDITFSPPKSVSVLWSAAEMAGDQQLADTIRQINRDCARQALEGMHRMGAFEVRRGSGGANREAPDFLLSAGVEHATSREGDPQLHYHCVTIASGFRHDGDGVRASALDSRAILDHRKAAMDLHHSLVADRLKALGFGIERTDDAFEVSGIRPELMDSLSTRRGDVMERARELGYTGAVPHAVKERLMLQMRKPKETDDPAECQERWAAGYEAAQATPAEVIASARAAGRETREASEPSVDQGGTSGSALDGPDADLDAQIRIEALDSLNEGHAVFCRSEVQKAVYGACRARVSGDDHFRIEKEFLARDVIEVVRHDGSIASDERGRKLYTTQVLLAAEKRLLCNAIDRQGEREFIARPGESIAAAAEASGARGITLTDEQLRALSVASSRDGVSVIEGSAGAGKSTVMRAVNDIYASQDYRVIGAAPSWKAALGLKASAGIEECRASQGLALRLADGREKIDAKTLIVLDEAGMVSTRQLDTILHHARLAGAKVILTGDTRQLSAVDVGSPMEALIRHLPAESVCRIAQVRRQSIGWQRDATQAMSAGKMRSAIDTYFSNGRIELHDTGADARAGVESDCRAALRDGKAFLALTVRNADARALNEALRPIYREAGHISGDDVIVNLRHRDGVARETALAAGDRLLMGERVSVFDAAGQETHLNTSQVVTVLSIENGVGGTRITLDADGESVSARLADMVGYRSASETGDRVPRMQHAYAMTVYSNQGETISTGGGRKDGLVSIYNGGGFNSATTLVALSRHTEDVRIHVDAGRVHDLLFDRKLADGRAPGDVTVSPGEIEGTIRAEFEAPSKNMNIIDVYGHGHLDRYLATTRLRSGIGYASAPGADRFAERREKHLDSLKTIERADSGSDSKDFERTIKALEKAHEPALERSR